MTHPYRLPTMNINYHLPFDDFKRLVDGTEPQYAYYVNTEVAGETRSKVHGKSAS